jgi:hypothetical protein
MKSAKDSQVHDIELLDLPRVNNPAGNITAINNEAEIPFATERVYYLYDIPSGESRGGHAHKELQQLIVAASGSFTVVLDDGVNKKSVTLNRPDKGLYLIPGIWRELVDFSSGAICLVLASMKYEAEDYIREYQEFTQFKSKR